MTEGRWAARMPLRALVVAVLVGIAASSAPAAAETGVVQDPTGDAPARHDLTRISFVSDVTGVSARVHVRDLRTKGTQVAALFVVTGGGQEADYAALSVRRPDGRVRTRLLRYDGSVVPCGVVGRWRPRADTIRLHIPHECVGNTGRVRTYVAIGAGDGTHGDPADSTRPVNLAFG